MQIAFIPMNTTMTHPRTFAIAAVFFILSFLFPLSLKADVKLPALFSDHAVLQKSAHVPVWGKADPEEKVIVTLDGHTASTTTGADGRWALELDLKDSGAGPFAMTVEGKNKLALSDVVVGEVWVASGQSNMQFLLKNEGGATEEIAKSANPLLRQFIVTPTASKEPLDDVSGRWMQASPENAGNFSAVAYFFSKKLQNELKVPVGVINSSWGGTHCEAWTRAEALDSVPFLKEWRENLVKKDAEYPAIKKAWLEQVTAWINDTNRQDRPTADTSSFCGLNVDTSSWARVNLPGEIKASRLPNSGAVWIRKEITLPKSTGNLGFYMNIDGIEAVYWNGKKITETKIENYSGSQIRNGAAYQIPAADIVEGKNVLSFRLYEPLSPAKFIGSIKLGQSTLDGEWLAKAEYEFSAAPTDKPAPKPLTATLTPPQNFGSSLYNGMINPLIPYAIRGVIWYQGESNANRALDYRTAFPLMISDWRKQWQRGDFPFYFCQLANYQNKINQPADQNWAFLREAQEKAFALPNTGEAILIDVGESGDIHPRNKKDPGERLARIALAKDYGQKVSHAGPMYDSLKIDGAQAIVRFRNAESGLVSHPLPETYVVESFKNKTAPLARNSPGSELEGFAICGDDKKWYWANAKIAGDTVIVTSDQVPSPVAVRYAWADNPTCNLYNGDDLPASPFRTDDFPPAMPNQKF